VCRLERWALFTDKRNLEVEACVKEVIVNHRPSPPYNKRSKVAAHSAAFVWLELILVHRLTRIFALGREIYLYSHWKDWFQERGWYETSGLLFPLIAFLCGCLCEVNGSRADRFRAHVRCKRFKNNNNPFTLHFAGWGIDTGFTSREVCTVLLQEKQSRSSWLPWRRRRRRRRSELKMRNYFHLQASFRCSMTVDTKDVAFWFEFILISLFTQKFASNWFLYYNFRKRDGVFFEFALLSLFTQKA